MTNIQLRKLLSRYPDGMKVSIELDSEDQDRSKTLSVDEFFVDTDHSRTEILLHNDQQYNETH